MSTGTPSARGAQLARRFGMTGGKSAAVHPEIGLTRGPDDRRGSGYAADTGCIEFRRNRRRLPRTTAKAHCRNRKTLTKSMTIGFGTVFAAVQHTGPTGAVRAAR